MKDKIKFVQNLTIGQKYFKKTITSTPCRQPFLENEWDRIKMVIRIQVGY